MKGIQEVIYIEAGEKIEILNRSFSSIPMSYEFSAKAFDSKPLSGQLEIESKQLFFAPSVKVKDLKSINSFKASIWDTFLNVSVVANHDMEITEPKRVLKSSKQSLFFVALIILIASVAVVVISAQ